MRKGVTTILFVAACAQSPAQEQLRERFDMCDPARIMQPVSVDFQTGGGMFEDVLSFVLRCGTDDTCMRFPINLSTPPRLPSARGDTVQWLDDGYSFSLSPNADGTRYNIRSESPPRVAPGGRFPPLVQYLVYDRETGVQQIQLEDLGQGAGGERPRNDTPKWVACGGNLRFADIDALFGSNTSRRRGLSWSPTTPTATSAQMGPATFSTSRTQMNHPRDDHSAGRRRRSSGARAFRSAR